MNNLNKSHQQKLAKEETLILKGRLLKVARIVWLLIAGTSIILFIIGIPLHYQNLSTPCSGEECGLGQLTLEEVSLLEADGFSLTSYGALSVGVSIFIALVYVPIGLLIFWRRSNDWTALTSSLWLITFGVSLYEGEIEAVGRTITWLQPMVDFIILLSGSLLLSYFFFTFPNGRFTPRWTRWLWLLNIIVISTFTLWPFPPEIFYSIGPPIWGLTILSGIGAQIYRYRRVAGPYERQQTKWVIFSLAITFAIITFALLVTITEGIDLITGIYERVGAAIAFSVIPIGIGISILRYQLLDIDFIIRRTVLYSMVSAVLVAVYFGSITVLQGMVTAVTNSESPLAIVLSTLLIAALFNPLRGRIQDFIDRRFYRRKYDAQQVLARFAQTSLDETDIENLTAELLEVVNETIEPANVSLWLNLRKSR